MSTTELTLRTEDKVGRAVGRKLLDKGKALAFPPSRGKTK